jgi:hypothetical protein
VKQVVLVSLEVERQVQHRDQFVLKLPRPVADYPAHIGVLCHPRRQHLLTLDEGHAIARPHPPQLDPEFTGKQAAQRLAQRRALRVAGVVGFDPFPEGSAYSVAVRLRRPVRADPRIQKPPALKLAAGIGHHHRRQLLEPPPVDTVLGGNRRRAGQDVPAGVHLYGVNKPVNLI